MARYEITGCATALFGDGWQGNTQILRQLAAKGEELRRRYEAECSYEWACNSESYRARTEALENETIGLATRNGLHIYLQTDCRGATVYIDTKPIPDNAYNRAHCLTTE